MAESYDKNGGGMKNGKDCAPKMQWQTQKPAKPPTDKYANKKKGPK